MNVAWRILSKDLRGAARSWYLWVMGVGAPLMILALFAAAFPLVTPSSDRPSSPLRLGLLSLESPESLDGQRLRQILEDDRLAGLLRVSEQADLASLQACLDLAGCDFGLVIPADFAAALRRPDIPLQLELISHVPDHPFRGAVESVLTTLVERLAAPFALRWVLREDERVAQQAQVAMVTWLHDEANLPRSEIQTRPSTETQRFVWSTMIGVIIFFMYFTAAFGAQSILKEREGGTLQRLLMTPTSTSWIFLGKALSIIVQLTLQVVFVMLGAWLFFGLMPESLGLGWLAAACLIVPASGFGMLVGALVRRSQSGAVAISVIAMLSGVVGGLFTFGMTLPAWLDGLTRLVPQGLTRGVWQSVFDLASQGNLVWDVALSIAVGLVLLSLGVIAQRRLLS